MRTYCRARELYSILSVDLNRRETQKKKKGNIYIYIERDIE